MRILVTGSTGFVGRHLVPKLIQRGHQVLELTIEHAVSQHLYGDDTTKLVVTENQDELKSGLLEFKPEIVIHLASFLTSLDDYDTLNRLVNVNVRFYLRVLDALKESDLQLFINTGTFAEYFNGDDILDPAYLYSATKTASRAFLDYYSRTYGFKQITVVPYTIYGGKDTQKKIIDLIFDSLEALAPLDLSPGEQTLDFIHVDDVADFYLHLINNIRVLPQKKTYKLGTGVGHTIKQLASMIEEITKKQANINWGGKPYRPSDVMFAVANIENCQSINWNSKVGLFEGLNQYIKNKSDR